MEKTTWNMERGTVTAAPGASSVIFRSSLTGNSEESKLIGQETVTSEPELEVHRGTLAKTVEEGGWLLKTTGKEYLLLSIQQVFLPERALAARRSGC